MALLWPKCCRGTANRSKSCACRPAVCDGVLGPDILEATGIDQGDIGYTAGMAKHLVDIDESALAAAQAELGTPTMKDTVNEALRRASSVRDARVAKALDRLGRRELAPREQAWR